MKREKFGLLSGFIAVIAVLLLVLIYRNGRLLGTITNQGSFTMTAPKNVIIQVPFQMTVDLDTKSNKVNAVGVYLSFDPARLQLLQLDSQQSFCQFYPEKKFDNQLGLISLACGSPHPGVTGKNTLLVLEFIPTKLG